jgi:hypothetical protein
LRSPSFVTKAGSLSRVPSSISTSWKGLQSPETRHHGNAHRIDRAVEFGNRPVEHRHHVVPLEIGGVRQDQVGEGRHLGMEGVADDEEGDLVFALLILVVQHLAALRPRSWSSSTPCWP